MLRRLTKDFDYVVAVVEESKDLAKYSSDELMSSLQAHEVRLSRSYETIDEKSFQVNGETFKNYGRGRGRGGYRGKGCGKRSWQSRIKR